MSKHNGRRVSVCQAFYVNVAHDISSIRDVFISFLIQDKTSESEFII